MFELIKTLPLLFRIPCAEISMDSFTNACIWPGQGLSGNYNFREQHKYSNKAIWEDNTVTFFTSIFSQSKNVDT